MKRLSPKDTGGIYRSDFSPECAETLDASLLNAPALKHALFLAALLAVLLFSGCASYGGYQSVPSSSVGAVQRVQQGEVIATRTVVIDGQATARGQSSGAIIGSAAGQTLGEGSGRILAAAGGGVLGGIVGGMVEKQLTTRQAQELTVELEDGRRIVVIQEQRNAGFLEGDQVKVTIGPSGGSYITMSEPELEGLF